MRVVLIELEGRVWLYAGDHAGGEEAGGRLDVLEPCALPLHGGIGVADHGHDRALVLPDQTGHLLEGGGDADNL